MASPPTTLEATVREAYPDHTRIPVRSRLRQAAAAFSIIAALMTIQMSWAPGWKTSEIQTCCPG